MKLKVPFNKSQVQAQPKRNHNRFDRTKSWWKKPFCLCLPLKRCCIPPSYSLNKQFFVFVPPLIIDICFSFSPGGLILWLVLWLVVVKPGGVSACPRLCVCYPTPMTVSCQSQNLTIVPAGVPYDSQRVFLQNNRITELRADSFGFETQVSVAVFSPILFVPSHLKKNVLIHVSLNSSAGALAVWKQHHMDWGWSFQ